MHNALMFYSDMYTTFRGATFCEKLFCLILKNWDKKCPRRDESTWAFFYIQLFSLFIYLPVHGVSVGTEFRLAYLTTYKPFNCIYLSTWMFSLHHPTQMTVSAEDDGVSLYSEVSGFFSSAFFDEECLLRKNFFKDFIRPMGIVFNC